MMSLKKFSIFSFIGIGLVLIFMIAGLIGCGPETNYTGLKVGVLTAGFITLILLSLSIIGVFKKKFKMVTIPNVIILFASFFALVPIFSICMDTATTDINNSTYTALLITSFVMVSIISIPLFIAGLLGARNPYKKLFLQIMSIFSAVFLVFFTIVTVIGILFNSYLCNNDKVWPFFICVVAYLLFLIGMVSSIIVSTYVKLEGAIEVEKKEKKAKVEEKKEDYIESLKKYKKALDEGLITKAEYEKHKKELLG